MFGLLLSATLTIMPQYLVCSSKAEQKLSLRVLLDRRASANRYVGFYDWNGTYATKTSMSGGIFDLKGKDNIFSFEVRSDRENHWQLDKMKATYNSVIRYLDLVNLNSNKYSLECISLDDLI